MRPWASCVALFIAALSAGGVSEARQNAPAPDGAGITVSNVTEPAQKFLFEVDVTDGLLSVDVRKAYFGEVMEAVAREAGFTADIAEGVFDKKLSARFSNIKIERGITRLITLIKEKNYFIYYGPDGSIRRVEVQGASVSKPPPTPTRRTRTSTRQRRPRALPPPVAPPPPPGELTEPSLTEDERWLDEGTPGPETGLDEEEPGAPYIPPSKEPVYIPPVPR